MWQSRNEVADARARWVSVMLVASALGCGGQSAKESRNVNSVQMAPDMLAAGSGAGENFPVGTAGAGGDGSSIDAAGGASVHDGQTVDGGPAADGGESPAPDTGEVPVPPPLVGPGPTIPALTGECPDFVDSVITFKGLAGVRIVVGPKPAEPIAPLVFYWHGTNGLSEQFERYSAVAQGVRDAGGVLISFQNSAGPDITSGTFIFGAGDLPLVDQLVACAVRDRNVDPRRIYTTGCSAGGLFSTVLAAERSQYVAAVVPDSGGLLGPDVAWQSEHTPPIMTMHGKAGTDVVVVDFSVTSANADKAYKAHGGFVVNCNHMSTHCDAWKQGLDKDMWAFLMAHPYGSGVSPWAGGLPADSHPSCAIY